MATGLPEPEQHNEKQGIFRNGRTKCELENRSEDEGKVYDNNEYKWDLL